MAFVCCSSTCNKPNETNWTKPPTESSSRWTAFRYLNGKRMPSNKKAPHLTQNEALFILKRKIILKRIILIRIISKKNIPLCSK